ncbi:UNVERIFIED_CONTAM: hypothetical protein K2H54_050691 [Gekko kuhli]
MNTTFVTCSTTCQLAKASSLTYYTFLAEVDLPLKKDGFTSEGTTLEALLRGEGLEKKIDTKEEDTLQEIQRVLENDENADEVNEEEEMEEDIPKRKNRPRGRPHFSEKLELYLFPWQSQCMEELAIDQCSLHGSAAGGSQ